MTDEEFDKFDSRTNHLKYPKGDSRRLTDIADALTKAGERHVKEATAIGIAIQCQNLPALEAKDLIKSYAISVAREAVEDEIKTNVDAYNSIVELQSSSKGKFEDAIYVKGKEQAAMSILSRIESKLKEES